MPLANHLVQQFYHHPFVVVRATDLSRAGSSQLLQVKFGRPLEIRDRYADDPPRSQHANRLAHEFLAVGSREVFEDM